MGAVAAKDPAGLPSAERNQPGLFILSEDLQAHFVVDLLAFLDDDALGQLLSSEASKGIVIKKGKKVYHKVSL